LTSSAFANRTVAGLALAVALVAAGCGSAAQSSAPSPSTTRPPATPAPSTPAAAATSTAGSSAPELPTTGRIEVTDRGYAVTLPENWFRIDLDDEGIEAIMNAGVGELPDAFGPSLKSQMQQMLANGVSILAYRFADADAPAGTNINVLTLPAGGYSLEAITELNVAQLKQILGPDEEITATPLTLPAGEAVRLEYETAFGSNTPPSSLIQYLVLGNGDQLFLSCTVPQTTGNIDDECRAVAESIEFLP
jgi:hypothetical protein